MSQGKLLATVFLLSTVSIANASSTSTFVDYNDFLPTVKTTRTYAVTNYYPSTVRCSPCLTKVIDVENPSTTAPTISRKYSFSDNSVVYNTLNYQRNIYDLKLLSIIYKNPTGISKTTYSDYTVAKSTTLSSSFDSDYYLSNPLGQWNAEYVGTNTGLSGSTKYLYATSSFIEKVANISVRAGTYNNCIKQIRSFSSGSRSVEWHCPVVGMVKKISTQISGQNQLWEMTGIQQ